MEADLRQAHQRKSSPELSEGKRLVIEAGRQTWHLLRDELLDICCVLNESTQIMQKQDLNRWLWKAFMALQVSKPCQHYRSSRNCKTLPP
jgi:hypothetical protein